MRVNRKFLYWGVFFATMGAVLVAADLVTIDDAAVADALRLWPLVFVAFGLAIVLRRTQFSLAGGMIAAALPGLVIGGAIAVAPRTGFDCASGVPAAYATQQGSFTGSATVDVTTSCGELSISTAPGSGWRLDAGNTADNSASVTSTGSLLSISGSRRNGWFGWSGRDVWRLTLPTSPISDLSLVVNAGEGHINLSGAQLGSLEMANNAAASTVDLSTATVSSISGTVNAGAVSLDLPAGQNIVGTFHVNAGSLKVCAPPGLGVRVHHTGVLSSARYGDLVQSGSEWQSPDYATAAYHADFTSSVNVGSIDFNPIGGCK